MTRVRTFIVSGLLLGVAALVGTTREPGGASAAQATPAAQTGRGAQPPAPEGRGQGRQTQPSAQEGLDRMGIVGYADHMTAQPGDTVKFMVSSNAPRYRADIIRLIHGDANPKGPGVKETVVETPANADYPGKRQALPLGSYATVPDNAALRLGGSFTITARPAADIPLNPLHSMVLPAQLPDLTPAQTPVSVDSSALCGTDPTCVTSN